MTDTQLIVMVAMPLLAIATNVALFLYAVNRIDNLADQIGELRDRVTRLEPRPAILTK